MKVPVSVKALLWAAFSVCLSLAVTDIPKLSSVLANPVVSTQPGDRVKVPSFYVNVTLTEKARRRLEESKETIIVSASVYGEPKKNSPVKVNDVGLVDLVNNRQIELPGAGRVQFNNLVISATKLDQLVSKDYTVNINVFSGRRSSQDNLLACDFFDGKISKIQPGITLKCGLIGEYSSQYINSSSNPIRENLSQSNTVPARVQGGNHAYRFYDSISNWTMDFIESPNGRARLIGNLELPNG